jgi:hypothetical protein
MLRFAEILRAHWPSYVARATGPIPARHWRAVEAVLSCRTSRRGGHVQHCARCRRDHYFFHSCNHRSCPGCGGRGQAEWAAQQEARLLPVPYYLITVTVPDPLRQLLGSYPRELYPLFFAESAAALKELCANPRYLGGEPGFIAVLHTWTRRMLHHPHLHLLVPALGTNNGGCMIVHPRQEEYLLPERALARRLRARFEARLKSDYPELAQRLDLSRGSQDWVVQCKAAGRGRSALRYLAAYVKKSAFSEGRLAGYDQAGRVLLRYKDSSDSQWKLEPLEPLELIRRWLLHVLPRGLVRVRHYGWLSPAARTTFRRIRFLLGLGAVRVRKLPALALVCPSCQGPLRLVGRIAPGRGPPLSSVVSRHAPAA